MQTYRWKCVAAVVVWTALSGCPVADGSCPECPDSGLRDAAATCTEIGLACRDGGHVMPAEACAYDDDPARCFVRAGDHAVACAGDCSACASALSQLRVDVCVADVDACASTPCQNGGTCRDGLGTFTCTCKPGFAGARCESDVDECLTSPCSGAGRICRNTVGSYVCACPAGFTGPACDVDVNECAQSGLGCTHGGVCTNLVGSFRCTCPPGFTGDRCENDVRVCGGYPTSCAARNASTCTMGDGCSSILKCSGTPNSCFSYSTSTSCGTASGCYWSSYYGCSGSPTSCSSRTIAGCDDGCSTTSCTGLATACSTFSRETCASQPGCTLVAP